MYNARDMLDRIRSRKPPLCRRCRRCSPCRLNCRTLSGRMRRTSPKQHISARLSEDGPDRDHEGTSGRPLSAHLGMSWARLGTGLGDGLGIWIRSRVGSGLKSTLERCFCVGGVLGAISDRFGGASGFSGRLGVDSGLAWGEVRTDSYFPQRRCAR